MYLKVAALHSNICVVAIKLDVTGVSTSVTVMVTSGQRRSGKSCVTGGIICRCDNCVRGRGDALKSINDLISSATLYRADNVVIDPLVGRKPMNVLLVNCVVYTFNEKSS